MKEKITFFLGVWLLASSWALGSEEIPHVRSEMEGPDYWIARLSHPDEPLLTPDQIRWFNQKALRFEPTALDPQTLGEKVSASFFLLPLEEEEAALLKKKLFDRRGKDADKNFFAHLRENAALENIPEWISVRFGVTVEECSLRTVPSPEPVVEEPGDLNFDLFQQTTLHPGLPVAVVWESRDGAWVYLVTKLLRGWTQKENVALFTDKKALVAYQKGERLIVAERQIPFYPSPLGGPIGGWVFGTVIYSPFLEEEGDFYRIARPVRRPEGDVVFSPVYVRREDIQREFLPLTQRQILMQGFKLFGAPYGWGGLRGGWDCSGFLRDVFLTMGLELPRNSGPQSRVGKILAAFPKGTPLLKKKAILEKSIPAASFVKLENHIMLYLGESDDRYYVLHATAGYRQKEALWKGFREEVVVSFRVLVSDMELGEGTSKGSLLERTVSVNTPFD
ncbi:MAG: SH3 domain-containing protein [Candidatus Omnitrophota bacterium]